MPKSTAGRIPSYKRCSGVRHHVGADGSCLFAPCALAWPVAYLQLPRLIGKGDETEGILCQLDDLLVMLREKLDHDKNLFRT